MEREGKKKGRLRYDRKGERKELKEMKRNENKEKIWNGKKNKC